MNNKIIPLIGGSVSLLATACATVTSSVPADVEPTMTAEIDEFVTDAMDKVGIVPGLAVAVYTPEYVYVRGFGVTDVESREAVTGQTAFYIASSTKSLTAMTMAILDHEGTLDLDQTLAAYAPDAPFPEDARADEVTLRDLLTHTSGLSNSPLGFRAAFTGEHTPEINWDLLSKTKVNEKAPLGTFDYTNVGYNILTVLTDNNLDINWQDLVDETLIEPLGMDETTAYMSKASAPGQSLARPHFGGMEAGPVKLSLEKIDSTMQSAGGHVMSASDAVRWLEVLVEDGMLDGRQVIPAEVVRSTRQPLANVTEKFDQYSRESYGLGWYNSTYKGEELIHHFGGYAGFRAHISYMPEHDIGVAVFSNEVPVAANFPEVVANFIYDRALGSQTALADANKALKSVNQRRDNIISNVKKDREKRAQREWNLTAPRSSYAGVYENEDYGTVDVAVTGQEMIITMGNLRAVAEPFPREDSARVEMVPFSGDVILFEVEEGGQPTALKYDGDVFDRVEG